MYFGTCIISESSLANVESKLIKRTLIHQSRGCETLAWSTFLMPFLMWLLYAPDPLCYCDLVFLPLFLSYYAATLVHADFKLLYTRSDLLWDLVLVICAWKLVYAHYSGLHSFDKWGPVTVEMWARGREEKINSRWNNNAREVFMTDLPFWLATIGTAKTNNADLKHPFDEILFSSSAGIKVTFQHIVWCLWDQF